MKVFENISDITNKDMEQMADSLERYLNDYDRYIIKEGVDEDEYENAKKLIEKLIRKLRKHDRSVFRDE